MLETYPDLSVDHADVVARHPLHPALAVPAALTQCLSNLFSSAVKFVAPGVRPRVGGWTEQTETRARLSVRGNGIGIDAKHHKKISAIFGTGGPFCVALAHPEEI